MAGMGSARMLKNKEIRGGWAVRMELGMSRRDTWL